MPQRLGDLKNQQRREQDSLLFKKLCSKFIFRGSSSGIFTEKQNSTRKWYFSVLAIRGRERKSIFRAWTKSDGLMLLNYVWLFQKSLHFLHFSNLSQPELRHNWSFRHWSTLRSLLVDAILLLFTASRKKNLWMKVPSFCCQTPTDSHSHLLITPFTCC